MLAPLLKDSAGDHDRHAVEIHLGRLWSLWDMLSFNAANFYDASIILRTFRIFVTSKDEDTKDARRAFDENSQMDKVAIGLCLDRAKELKRLLDQLGVTLGSMSVERLIKELENTWYPPTYGTIRDIISDIESRVRDQLSLVKVYTLDSRKAEFFEPGEPLLGLIVGLNFPGATYEAHQAGKCLAIGCDTAAVFHMMRIMEIGLRSVARCLEIPDPTKAAERNWGAMLRDIKKDMESRSGQSPTKAWKNPDDKEFFESVYASIDAVRVAWRNTTMHVEIKYTPDEAEHILGAVKGFMKKLASRADEEGKPPA
jgi:hypothetical protein